ncbi:MAG: Gfo/Idh/MocA family oxidoreductase [Clostridiales bacterium]|jgi:predicted dehydrogenase|nr:Gfo/Idh/MocA family oxidoreductase [Clostridiales bacterium]
MDIAILGAGNRGMNVYGRIFSSMAGARISAVCETDGVKLDEAMRRFRVEEKNCFADEDGFFARGVLADGLVIATMDRDHHRQTLKAIRTGYKKILLEKPVSEKLKEVEELVRVATANGVEILVCHVLRYSGFYKMINDIIKSGKIGDVIDVNHQENVGYWHFAHSFTRGNWRRADTSAPILLAKTCHDFDLLYWFVGSKCVKIQSYGELTHFRRECAPKGCTKRCLDGCAYIDSCPFSAKKLYLNAKTPIGWGIFHVAGKNGATTAEVEAALKDINNPYGRCVYHCDNDVNDHQVVIMRFENGATATLTVTAFSENCYRRIHVMGTKGEIIGTDSDKYLTVNVFGESNKKILGKKVNRIKIKNQGGHLGGDNGICETFGKLVAGEKIDPDYLTTIDVTLESHRMIFDAERSMRSGGTGFHELTDGLKMLK